MLVWPAAAANVRGPCKRCFRKFAKTGQGCDAVFIILPTCEQGTGSVHVTDSMLALQLHVLQRIYGMMICNILIMNE